MDFKELIKHWKRNFIPNPTRLPPIEFEIIEHVCDTPYYELYIKSARHYDIIDLFSHTKLSKFNKLYLQDFTTFDEAITAYGQLITLLEAI
jgi:hypothetical protein